MCRPVFLAPPSSTTILRSWRSHLDLNCSHWFDGWILVVVCFLGFWTRFWRYQFWGWFWEKFPALTQLFLILRGESKSRYQGFNFTEKTPVFYVSKNRISADVSLPLWKIHNKMKVMKVDSQQLTSFFLGPEMNAWHSKKMIPKRPWRRWSDGRDVEFERLGALDRHSSRDFDMKKQHVFQWVMAY